jgi:hypothetical protein
LIKPLRRKRVLGYGNGNGNANANENGVDMRCVIGHHDTQCAPVDAINRDNERSQPKRQHNGVRDTKVPKRQNNGERDAKVLVGHGGGG